MFFKSVLFSILISSTLLFSSLQAKPGDGLEIPHAKTMTRKLKKSADREKEMHLAVQLFNLWQKDLGGNFEQFLKFLKFQCCHTKKSIFQCQSPRTQLLPALLQKMYLDLAFLIQ